jgi:hypothetical protein
MGERGSGLRYGKEGRRGWRGGEEKKREREREKRKKEREKCTGMYVCMYRYIIYAFMYMYTGMCIVHRCTHIHTYTHTHIFVYAHTHQFAHMR